MKKHIFLILIGLLSAPLYAMWQPGPSSIKYHMHPATIYNRTNAGDNQKFTFPITITFLVTGQKGNVVKTIKVQATKYLEDKAVFTLKDLIHDDQERMGPLKFFIDTYHDIEIRVFNIEFLGTGFTFEDKDVQHFIITGNNLNSLKIKPIIEKELINQPTYINP